MLKDEDIAEILRECPRELVEKAAERLREWVPMILKLPEDRQKEVMRMLVQTVVLECQILEEAGVQKAG